MIDHIFEHIVFEHTSILYECPATTERTRGVSVKGSFVESRKRGISLNKCNEIMIMMCLLYSYNIHKVYYTTNNKKAEKAAMFTKCLKQLRHFHMPNVTTFFRTTNNATPSPSLTDSLVHRHPSPFGESALRPAKPLYTPGP